jgi:hypothetical protein
MRYFLIAAATIAALAPVRTDLDAAALPVPVAFQDDAPMLDVPAFEDLAPTTDARFGRTWRVEGLFGTGTAALINWKMLGAGQVELCFLSAKHVTDGNGDQFILVNEVLGLEIVRASASFVHPDEDAVVITAVVDADLGALVASTVMPIRWENLALGERVLLDGFGAGERWITEGRASGPRRISCPLFFGDSGSPLQDADGNVVGIVVMRGPANHHGHIVPMAAVREWLRGLGLGPR